MSQNDWRAPFNRGIWYLYRIRWLRWLVKCILWLILILCMYFLGKWANAKVSWDPVELCRAILNKLGSTPAPYTSVWVLYKFMYIGIPVLFILLCWRPIIHFFTFSCSPYEQLEILHGEKSPWELTELGRQWLNQKISWTLKKLKALRNEGCAVFPQKVTWICDTLYKTTHAKEINATCLKKIIEIHNDKNDKAYLENTMCTISSLKKFQFKRFYITSESFDELFNSSPSCKVKWFVQLHHDNDCALYYIPLSNYTSYCNSLYVHNDRRDILFYDGSLSLSFETDPNNDHKVVKNKDGKNILYAGDKQEDINKIASLFDTLRKSSYAIDVLQKIKEQKWDAYNHK